MNGVRRFSAQPLEAREEFRVSRLAKFGGQRESNPTAKGWLIYR